MTIRQRILAVYRGERPDVVPFMLDLSHWHYHKHHRPWDLSLSYDKPDTDLIDYHRKVQAGFYVPNLAGMFAVAYPPDVTAQTEKRTRAGRTEIVWRLQTPLGTIERARAWEESTYSWHMSQWGLHDERDLAVFAHAMGRRTFSPRWHVYDAWARAVGEGGAVYLSPGYSAMGHLLNYWMGIEATTYAVADFPDAIRHAVDAVNANILTLIDLLCESPAEIVLLGDNFSSDVQPPAFFDEWSRPFYEQAVRRLHAAGKYVAVHVDGRLRRAIEMIRSTGADCADAVTPGSAGDLTPAQCREEAGDEFILSGGISPRLWLPSVPPEQFAGAVLNWLAQKERTFRFIAAAGDQVPPGAAEDRIALMRDLVEEHGRY